MSTVKADSRRNPSKAEMVSWPLRWGHQCCGALFSHRCLSFLLFPAYNPCWWGYDELRNRNVWWHNHSGYCVLRCDWKISLYATCLVDEERFVVCCKGCYLHWTAPFHYTLPALLTKRVLLICCKGYYCIENHPFITRHLRCWRREIYSLLHRLLLQCTAPLWRRFYLGLMLNLSISRRIGGATTQYVQSYPCKPREYLELFYQKRGSLV